MHIKHIEYIVQYIYKICMQYMSIMTDMWSASELAIRQPGARNLIGYRGAVGIGRPRTARKLTAELAAT